MENINDDYTKNIFLSFIQRYFTTHSNEIRMPLAMPNFQEFIMFNKQGINFLMENI